MCWRKWARNQINSSGTFLTISRTISSASVGPTRDVHTETCKVSEISLAFQIFGFVFCESRSFVVQSQRAGLSARAEIGDPLFLVLFLVRGTTAVVGGGVG